MQVANPKIWFGSKISSNTNQAKTIEIALLAVDASMTDVPDARLKTCQENAAWASAKEYQPESSEAVGAKNQAL